MELAAATEDAQQSRLELRAARAELARAKAQQAAVRHTPYCKSTTCIPRPTSVSVNHDAPL
jgi:hypothetical protein